MPKDKVKSQELVDKSKKPKNSIPIVGDVIVKSLLYDIGYTKSAKERAEAEGREPNLFDGIYCKFIHLDYWDKDNNHKQLVKYDGAQSPTDVHFVCDTVDESGEVVKCWIENEDYLNIARLTNKFGPYGGFVKPLNEADVLNLYDASMCIQLGIDGGEISDLILQCVKPNISDDELARVGITRPTEDKFPVLSLYRYRDSWESKKEAGKKDSKIMLTGYNRTKKEIDLGGSKSIEWISGDVCNYIYEALVNRKKGDVPF